MNAPKARTTESLKRLYIDADAIKKLAEHPSWPVFMERKYEEFSQALVTWCKTPSADASWHSYQQGYIKRLMDEVAQLTAMEQDFEAIDPKDLDPEDRAGRIFGWLHPLIRRIGR